MALIPEHWHRRLTLGGGRLVLALGKDKEAALLGACGTGEEQLAALDLNAPQRAGEIIAALRSHRRIPEVATIRLPAEQALRTEMTLPLAAERNLAEVVSFELDRHTPFRNDEVYHGERIIKRDRVQQRLTVELTIVPRAIVDAALPLAASIGLACERVEALNAGNLLPHRPRSVKERLPGLAVMALASVALLLGLAALLIPINEAHRAAATLAAELSNSKRLAEESQKIGKEIDAEMQESGFLGTRKRSAASISEVLLNLTQLLADDTWLNELEVTGSEVRLSGYAASASTVLGVIDQSPYFSNAGFRSPVTQNQKLNREQFSIAARITHQDPP